MYDLSIGLVLGLITAGTLIYIGGVSAARLLAPRVRTAEKVTTYESGVEPEGQGWAQVNSRYYLYAFIYVLFAVDAIYLFPWATVLQQLGLASLVEMVIFLGVLAVGLFFAIGRGLVMWR